jgi:hypothetical protein
MAGQPATFKVGKIAQGAFAVRNLAARMRAF